MTEVEHLTLEILRDIRDAVRDTNAQLERLAARTPPRCPRPHLMPEKPVVGIAHPWLAVHQEIQAQLAEARRLLAEMQEQEGQRAD